MKTSTISKAIPGVMLGAGLAAMACSSATAQERPALTVAVNELARSLDPGEHTGNVDTRIYYSIFDTLIRFDEKGQNVNIKAAAVQNLKRKPTVVLPEEFSAAKPTFPVPGWNAKERV